MRKIKFAFPILIMALILFISCGNGKPNNSDNRKEGSLIGAWTLEKTEGFDMGYSGKESILTFKEDGNYEWNTDNLINVKGTYTFANDTLTTTSPTTDGSTMDVQYVTKFKEGQLIMSLVTDPQYQTTFIFK